MCTVANIPDDIPYSLQHSKLKLKFPETKTLVSKNPDSNKYN